MRNEPEASGETDISFPFFNLLKTYTITVINSMFVFLFWKGIETSIGSNLCGTTCELDMGGLFSIYPCWQANFKSACQDTWNLNHVLPTLGSI